MDRRCFLMGVWGAGGLKLQDTKAPRDAAMSNPDSQRTVVNVLPVGGPAVGAGTAGSSVTPLLTSSSTIRASPMSRRRCFGSFARQRRRSRIKPDETYGGRTYEA